jgi:hypothetical protein
MTDLSTPKPPIGLPPMTLEQAVELANRVRTVQHGLIDLMTRNASPDSLLDHAAHAYKAAIVLFEHAVEAENALIEVKLLLDLIQGSLLAARADPVDGPILDAILTRHFTESGGMDTLG